MVSQQADGNYNLFRVGRAHIIKQLIMPSGQLAHLFHSLFYYAGNGVIDLFAASRFWK